MAILKHDHPSAAKMRMLNYDPIMAVVETRGKIAEMIRDQEKLRDGKLVRMRADGRPQNFSATVFLDMHLGLAKVDESLLRYKYGRVPETININEERTQPLIINLTSKGETYCINPQPELEGDNDAE
jgi:hypothetical protein